MTRETAKPSGTSLTAVTNAGAAGTGNLTKKEIRMRTLELYYNDLTPEAQKKYLEVQGYPTQGAIPTIQTLPQTHTEIGTVDAPNMEALFMNMQDETMSPDCKLKIQKTKASHTSMSMGDVVKEGNKYYITHAIGFTQIF
jgi:hypothetical protein